MPVRLYEPFASNTKLRLYIDLQEFVIPDELARVAVIDEFQALGDNARSEVAICLGTPDLATYDQGLSDEEEDILDRADYPTYDTRVHQIVVADGAWFRPIAVESVCAEDVGNEASKAIDDNPATFWRDSTNHQHFIIVEVRAHAKKIEGFRFLYGSGESARERLNNVAVHASRGIANIDDADNILETGINMAWPTGISVDTWVEHTLLQKKNKARFIKFVIDDTDNGNNQAQIRKVEIRVGTRDP